MYLNFDNDSPVQHLRIFDKLFTALCTLAAVKRPRGVSSDSDGDGYGDDVSFVLDHEQLRLKQQALASVEAVRGDVVGGALPRVPTRCDDCTSALTVVDIAAWMSVPPPSPSHLLPRAVCHRRYSSCDR